MKHYSKREKLNQYVNNPKYFGLSKEEEKNSHIVLVQNCSDNFKIYIDIKNNKINKIRFNGSGCSISFAAMEAMCGALENKSIDESKEIISNYENFINGKIKKIDSIFDVFEIIQEHKSRAKCALAPIDTLNNILKK